MVANIDTEFRNLIHYDMQQMRNLYYYVEECTVLDIQHFSDVFMRSGIRQEMDGWHVHYSNEPAHEIVRDLMMLENPILVPKKDYYGCQITSWIGMAYAYFRYYTQLPSSSIVELLDFETMLRYFSIGHEMSFEAWANRVIREINEAEGI